MTRFWNNLLQVRSKLKDWKGKLSKGKPYPRCTDKYKFLRFPFNNISTP